MGPGIDIFSGGLFRRLPGRLSGKLLRGWLEVSHEEAGRESFVPSVVNISIPGPIRRYEAKTESAPNQAAPQQKSYQVPPLVPQQVSQTRNVPLQTPPPGNLTSVAMNAAANAHTGVNVFESCRCNNGLATKGNLKQEVLEKCAQPVIRQFSGSRDCGEIWLYNFGPNEFMQGICFDGNRVNKVLSLDHGY